MKRYVLLTVLVGLCLAANAGASPWPCDCIGGYDYYASPTYWYLLDYYGYPHMRSFTGSLAVVF